MKKVFVVQGWPSSLNRGGTLIQPALDRARELIAGDEIGKIIILSDGYF